MSKVQNPAPPADQAAIARIGAAVRARLAGDQTVQKVPTDRAEIYAVGNFLRADECSRLIEMIDRVAQPSKVFDLGYAANYRTSYSGDVERHDPFVQMIERRLDDLIGLPHENGETFQGQRYLPGQEFKPHMDWFDTLAKYWPDEELRGGQRCFTAMAYLNDVEEGGHTDFPRIGINIPPQQGALIVWNNSLPDGAVNFDTMHAGTPVLRGVKYVITKWYRTRRWG